MIEPALLQRLESDPEIVSRVGQRIFWDKRPQSGPLAALPAIVFAQVTTGYVGSHDLDLLGDVQLQYSIFAETREETRAIADLIRRRLHGWRELTAGIQRVRTTTSVDVYEQDTGIYSTVLTVQVWHSS